MAHRGPDGEGYYSDSLIALGHRRLSIIDLKGGKQPISNETGTLQLVCNGEIYNSPQLRRELIAAGHTFKTSTDVEVILHLYEEHGNHCVKYLRGMFAFAIWDSVDHVLFLARDHLGQKPFQSAKNNLGIDPRTVAWKRVMDMNDRAIRNIVSGLGGKGGGIMREAGFNITAASEIMDEASFAAGLFRSASSNNSIATMLPKPRTSAICAKRVASAASPFWILSPNSRLRWHKSSSSMTSNTASAAAHPNG